MTDHVHDLIGITGIAQFDVDIANTPNWEWDTEALGILSFGWLCRSILDIGLGLECHSGRWERVPLSPSPYRLS